MLSNTHVLPFSLSNYTEMLWTSNYVILQSRDWSSLGIFLLISVTSNYLGWSYLSQRIRSYVIVMAACVVTEFVFDVLRCSQVQSVHPKTGAVTVLTIPGPSSFLPSQLLDPALDPSLSTFSSDLASVIAKESLELRKMVITSPTMLETALLDLDGRLERSNRPISNAWKVVHVWRSTGGAQNLPVTYNDSADMDIQMTDSGGEKGMRTSYGTLFYLRGCM